ncbi:MAG: polysaccharide deacetylase family protein [Bacteroidales bacterium]
MLIRVPRIVKRLYPSFIWKIPVNDKRMFLTFDDGPSPVVTPKVLDLLDKYNAKATFFCLGKNVELYPEIYQEIIKRGHKVGNHTYSHQQGWHMENNLYIRDVDIAAELIKSNLFRPPYAKIKPSQAKLIDDKYFTIMWSILSRDYNRKLSAKQCARNVIKYFFPGAIIVFHDSEKCWKNLSYALPITLEMMTRAGYVSDSIRY